MCLPWVHPLTVIPYLFLAGKLHAFLLLQGVSDERSSGQRRHTRHVNERLLEVST
jgi:hypothetical protein